MKSVILRRDFNLLVLTIKSLHEIHYHFHLDPLLGDGKYYIQTKGVVTSIRLIDDFCDYFQLYDLYEVIIADGDDVLKTQYKSEDDNIADLFAFCESKTILYFEGECENSSSYQINQFEPL